MPNNSNSGGGNGAMTALLAILVIAVVGFGIWYVMDQQKDESGAGVEINLGTTQE